MALKVFLAPSRKQNKVHTPATHFLNQPLTITGRKTNEKGPLCQIQVELYWNKGQRNSMGKFLLFMYFTLHKLHLFNLIWNNIFYLGHSRPALVALKPHQWRPPHILKTIDLKFGVHSWPGKLFTPQFPFLSLLIISHKWYDWKH